MTSVSVVLGYQVPRGMNNVVYTCCFIAAGFFECDGMKYMSYGECYNGAWVCGVDCIKWRDQDGECYTVNGIHGLYGRNGTCGGCGLQSYHVSLRSVSGRRTDKQTDRQTAFLCW